MAIEVVVQRLELGDVVLVSAPGQDEEKVEATVARDIDRTESTVRVRLRAAGGQDFVKEWPLDELITCCPRALTERPGSARVTVAKAAASARGSQKGPISHHRDEEDGSGLPHTRRRILTGGPVRCSEHSSAARAPRAGHHDLSACPTSDACWDRLT